MMTTSEVKHLAIDLENELFGRHKAVDTFYRQHYQGLVKLLKHSSHEVGNIGFLWVDYFGLLGFYRLIRFVYFMTINCFNSWQILNGEKSLDDFVERALLEDDDILSTVS